MDPNRPRPRPKPKPKAAAQLDAVTTSISITPSSPSKLVQVRDDDEMFMRNKGRTTKTWETLEKLNKDTEIIHVDSDSDDTEALLPRQTQKRKVVAAPVWQGSRALGRLLSADLSDGSDDGIEFIGTSTTQAGLIAKRKRPRTRSRSITPPPALPLHQLQNARALVKKTLNIAPDPASPTQRDEPDSDTPIFQNPELARIAKLVASRSHSQVPASSPPPPESTETIRISVKWQPHPLDKAGKEHIWILDMNREDNFRSLFENTAEEASILTESLIMSYGGKRIFASVTPMTLQIWGEAELVACDKTTYEYLRNNSSTASQLFNTRIPTPDISSDTDTPSPSKDREAESESEDDTFKLILRSSITPQDITLTVRPTTKCGAIVQAFLKKAGIADRYTELFRMEPGSCATMKGAKCLSAEIKDPRLCVDGDRMENDVEIGNAELEDGDLVEVVGL